MMLRFFAIALISAGIVCGEPKYEKRLQSATEAFKEIMAAPDNSIPQDLLDRAQCIVIIPGAKKGAFIFGGKYGRGFLTCRRRTGIGWTGPGAVRMEGFNFGFQLGGAETDIVMLIMNQKGVRRLLKSKFTIGADISAAAGPVGRTVTANTDALMTAEILSYSRSRGVFAGVSLNGASLREDRGVNRKLYGKDYSNRDIVLNDVPPPRAAKPLVKLLNRYSSRKGR